MSAMEQRIVTAAARGAACEFVQRGCDTIRSQAFLGLSGGGQNLAVTELVLQAAATSINAEALEAIEQMKLAQCVSFSRFGGKIRPSTNRNVKLANALDTGQRRKRTGTLTNTNISPPLWQALEHEARVLWQAFRCVFQANLAVKEF